MHNNNVLSNPAHPDGYTCLTFSTDGSYVYTGGTDYLVRIWSIEGEGMKEPESATDAEHEISSLSASHDFWLSASDDLVRRYVKHESQLNGFVTNTNGIRIRSVAIDPKGKRIAVASDELAIKILDAEDNSVVQKLDGHTKGVRRVTWDPTGSLLTSCGSDGKVIVWNMTSDQFKLEQVIDGIIPAVVDQESKEFQLYDCSIVWHTSGQHFYAVSRTHEIVTVNKSNWAKGSSFVDKDVIGAVTALAISPNGVYLASACQSNVYIWSTQTRRVVTQHTTGDNAATITSLAWCPKKNHLAWTDNNGEFFQWHKPIPDTLPDPVKPSISTNAAATISMKPKAGLDLFGEETGIIDGESTAAEGDEIPDVDLEAEDDYDNWIVDDLGGGMQDGPAAGPKVGDGYIKEMVSITKAQPPFQPGSTPMENKRCFLAYNLLGVIEVTDQDSHHIVNVDFFDRSTRQSYHFTDTFKHYLGYLGERGTVFACPPEGDHPAQVLFKPYGAWTALKEWTYQLKRKDSKILGVTCGGLPPSSSLRQSTDSDLQGYGDVVLATSEGDLTFLSGTGRERRIMGLGGDFVTMVAGPEWVFVVYRAGSTTIDGSQNLSYCIINLDDFSVRQRDLLPLPKGHTLKWVGLTDQGAPATYDSTGCVHVLTKFRVPHHASWARILDTNLLERRQGKDESYWPVGINENSFLCLILKGRQEYPGFPRPLIQELPINLPFRREEPHEEAIERQLLYTQIALDSLDEELTTDAILTRERTIDKEFLVLIQAACKSDNVARVIELSKLLHHLPSFDAAIKIAGFYHLRGLQEKLEILKNEREENEDRLIALRNKRKRWLKSEAVPREIASSSNSRGGGVNGNGKKYDPLSDTRPPPAIERPGMSRVTIPIVERTRYSSMAPQGHNTTHLAAQDESQATSSSHTTRSPSPMPWDDSANDTGTGTGKRKRDVIEESQVSSVATSSQVSSMAPPPPKQKTNPFARKANTTTNTNDPPKNPFAGRKTGLMAEGSKNTIKKSDSFFEKVEAAESEPTTKRGKKSLSSKKDKDTGTGGRQATLFGMMPRAFQAAEKPIPEPSQKPMKSQKKNINVTEDDDVVMVNDETQVDDDDLGLGEETQELLSTYGDVDISDSQMTEMDGKGLEETQLLGDDSQETQMI